MKRSGYLMEANWKCSENAEKVARHLGAFEEYPDPDEAIAAAQIFIQAARKGDQQLFHELARMVGVARGSGNPASLEAVMDLLRDTRAEHIKDPNYSAQDATRFCQDAGVPASETTVRNAVRRLGWKGVPGRRARRKGIGS